jgi:hypothetical protein
LTFSKTKLQAAWQAGLNSFLMPYGMVVDQHQYSCLAALGFLVVEPLSSAGMK